MDRIVKKVQDLSFEKAMQVIAKADKKVVDNKIQKYSKHEKLIIKTEIKK